MLGALTAVAGPDTQDVAVPLDGCCRCSSRPGRAIEISCSSVIERSGSAGSSFMDSDSTAVSDIKRLFLDHQIRR
ncbi:hypothetical protein AB0L05_22355 [Nonomuraea pusilla]|uniref:hypothetical protein n=1 Tax=Nonomuraea pusilla TaxID=46177 RepID=UPI003330C332